MSMPITIDKIGHSYDVTVGSGACLVTGKMNGYHETVRDLYDLASDICVTHNEPMTIWREHHNHYVIKGGGIVKDVFRGVQINGVTRAFIRIDRLFPAVKGVFCSINGDVMGIAKECGL